MCPMYVYGLGLIINRETKEIITNKIIENIKVFLKKNCPSKCKWNVLPPPRKKNKNKNTHILKMKTVSIKHFKFSKSSTLSPPRFDHTIQNWCTDSATLTLREHEIIVSLAYRRSDVVLLIIKTILNKCCDVSSNTRLSRGFRRTILYSTS